MIMINNMIVRQAERLTTTGVLGVALTSRFLENSHILIASIVITFMAVLPCSGQSKTLSDHEIDSKLSELKSLPKVHYSYSWIGGGIMDNPNNRRLYEYARITNALTFWGQSVNRKQFNNCVYTCARINKTKPNIPASVAACFNPWHRKFGEKLPPTDRGASYYEEIRYLSDRLRLIKKWLAEENQKYGSKVQLTAAILDCERFYVKEGSKKWNEGIREALDTIHKEAQSIFPEARIEWYGRGVKAYSGNRWAKRGNFTGKEIKSSLSCSLYTLPELHRTREAYRRTCQLADELGIKEVTPWVALGAGYRRIIDDKQKYFSNWPYDVIYSYQMGRELNRKEYSKKSHMYASYDRAKIVIFYPPPFNPATPDWSRHFIAYVRGATNVEKLDDLGYTEK